MYRWPQVTRRSSILQSTTRRCFVRLLPSSLLSVLVSYRIVRRPYRLPRSSTMVTHHSTLSSAHHENEPERRSLPSIILLFQYSPSHLFGQPGSRFSEAARRATPHRHTYICAHIHTPASDLFSSQLRNDSGTHNEKRRCCSLPWTFNRPMK